MKKVITYGTYDILHYGHIRLLERAKALGDYLIVGITGDGFDRTRGKINVQQSLMERIENVRRTGLADQIIVEEYEGQKIDDIKRYDVDIFTVGSDWKGKFDYLKEFCEVTYLDRTEGVSSTEIRTEKREIRIGLVGESAILNKFVRESRHVNGVSISGVCSTNTSHLNDEVLSLPLVTDQLDKLFLVSEALYIISEPSEHYHQIKLALEKGKHVLCESPITLSVSEYIELQQLAISKNLILMDGIKTAYSMAFNRLVLLVKSGIIGDVVSVDVTCTSLRDKDAIISSMGNAFWNSMSFWGPTALLPIFKILGVDYSNIQIVSRFINEERHFDDFSQISFIYPTAVANAKIGQGVKSEGELVISGSKGYVYIPAPWWKTDYFEVRYENQEQNKRYFYQLDGEGIRYEILSFAKTIENGNHLSTIERSITQAIIGVMEQFQCVNLKKIK